MGRRPADRGAARTSRWSPARRPTRRNAWSAWPGPRVGRSRSPATASTTRRHWPGPTSRWRWAPAPRSRARRPTWSWATTRSRRCCTAWPRAAGSSTTSRRASIFLVSTHVALLGFILIATVYGFGQPLLPIQILWLELFIDLSTSVAFELEKSEPDLMRRPPRRPGEPLLDGRPAWADRGRRRVQRGRRPGRHGRPTRAAPTMLAGSPIPSWSPARPSARMPIGACVSRSPRLPVNWFLLAAGIAVVGHPGLHPGRSRARGGVPGDPAGCLGLGRRRHHRPGTGRPRAGDAGRDRPDLDRLKPGYPREREPGDRSRHEALRRDRRPRRA